MFIARSSFLKKRDRFGPRLLENSQWNIKTSFFGTVSWVFAVAWSMRRASIWSSRNKLMAPLMWPPCKESFYQRVVTFQVSLVSQ